MLFNSYQFILLFLPITFFVYFWLNNIRLVEAAKIWLIISSLFFYSWWNPIYLPLIILSMLFNYSFGNLLTDNKKYKNQGNRKKILIFAITCNLLLLGYYKYADFFILFCRAHSKFQKVFLCWD